MASSPIGTNRPAIKTSIIADLRLLYHEAPAKWYNWPLGRKQATPANRLAVKTSIIADLRLLYHKLCDFAEKCKKLLQ